MLSYLSVSITQITAFAFDVLFSIFGFNPYSKNSVILYILKFISFKYISIIILWYFIFNLINSLRTLYAEIPMNNTCPPRITAAAGTRFNQGFFLNTVIIFFNKRALQSNDLLFTHEILLDQAFAHCPRFPTAGPCMKLGPCLSSNVAVHPSRSAKDFRLGKLLSYQLPNLT